MRVLTRFDHEMIGAAKRRAIVRLVSGELVTLISWGTRGGRNRARVEGVDGRTRFCVRTTEVIEVVQ